MASDRQGILIQTLNLELVFRLTQSQVQEISPRGNKGKGEAGQSGLSNIMTTYFCCSKCQNSIWHKQV